MIKMTKYQNLLLKIDFFAYMMLQSFWIIMGSLYNYVIRYSIIVAYSSQEPWLIKKYKLLNVEARLSNDTHVYKKNAYCIKSTHYHNIFYDNLENNIFVIILNRNLIFSMRKKRQNKKMPQRSSTLVGTKYFRLQADGQPVHIQSLTRVLTLYLHYLLFSLVHFPS